MIKFFFQLSIYLSPLVPLFLVGCQAHNVSVPADFNNQSVVKIIESTNGVEDRLEGTIIFRTVEPLFNAAQQSSLLQLISPEQPHRIFSKDSTCIGCHARSSKGMLALNIRRGKDRRLAIFQERAGVLDLVTARRIGEFSYLSWSPDGRYLAMVVNTFGVIDLKIDVAEPFGLSYKSGDLAIYDITTGDIKPLPGASEMDFVEDMPAWSSDGKELLFVRYKPEKDGSIATMDIYTIPFNDGNGGTVVPVAGASLNGLYNYFPSFSPDGAWISFVRGDSSKGVFARKSSDIYLVPRTGGAPKRLEFNRDGEMDSWHRWSPDGKWLIFAGKRDNVITALYASRIDKRGNAAPAVKIVGYNDRKINIPEFVTMPFAEVDYNQSLSEAIDEMYSNSP
jgi:dipeptidyl aminopeptidase/acylaminoacyl peptidase